MKAQSPIYTNIRVRQATGMEHELLSAKDFLIVIKAKAPNILKMPLQMHLFLARTSCKRWNYSTEFSEAIWKPTYRTRLKFCWRKSKYLSPSERGGSDVWWNAASSLQVKELKWSSSFSEKQGVPKCMSRTKAPGNLDMCKTSVCSLKNSVKNKPPHYYRIHTVLKKLKVSNNINIKSPSIKSTAR